MLALVSYIEEMKHNWRDFDLAVCENLQRTLGVDIHWYVARTDEDRRWYNDLPSGKKINRQCAASLDNIYHILGASPVMNYVNVQSPSFFESANVEMQWLKDFEHPKGHACYIVGSNQKPLEIVAGDNVSIDLVGSSLFSFCAAAIVLHDRRMKAA